MKDEYAEVAEMIANHFGRSATEPDYELAAQIVAHMRGEKAPTHRRDPVYARPMPLTVAEIHRRELEPEQLEARLQEAQRRGGGLEYTAAVGIIRGVIGDIQDHDQQWCLVSRVLDALDTVTAEK